MRHRFFAILALLVAIPGTACAAPMQDGGGWRMWEYRADGLMKAIETANLNLLDAHCSDVGRVLTRSGVKFPAWAQSLRPACAALRNLFEPVGDLRRVRIVCRNLKQAGKEIGRAREVAEAPEADDRARQISAMIAQLRKDACS
ncbi:hypothetical protein [Sphingomonas sp. G-3-2-10]|uniref:hypothetical protein n=1 Tax=Sphingomonas sp. G-3-2-10 TaxID=2728838 RepID=UPI00146CEF47|nr:hypothetical protein [Sphingomonas sp. G-3-2-10]NML07562.1 hypothetical protein [Sphingomonas sp. G-3-2-10]